MANIDPTKFTEADKEWLRSFRTKIDYDGIKIKEQIKQQLLDR